MGPLLARTSRRVVNAGVNCRASAMQLLHSGHRQGRFMGLLHLFSSRRCSSPYSPINHFVVTSQPESLEQSALLCPTYCEWHQFRTTHCPSSGEVPAKIDYLDYPTCTSNFSFLFAQSRPARACFLHCLPDIQSNQYQRPELAPHRPRGTTSTGAIPPTSAYLTTQTSNSFLKRTCLSRILMSSCDSIHQNYGN